MCTTVKIALASWLHLNFESCTKIKHPQLSISRNQITQESFPRKPLKYYIALETVCKFYFFKIKLTLMFCCLPLYEKTKTMVRYPALTRTARHK